MTFDGFHLIHALVRLLLNVHVSDCFAAFFRPPFCSLIHAWVRLLLNVESSFLLVLLAFKFFSGFVSQLSLISWSFTTFWFSKFSLSVICQFICSLISLSFTFFWFSKFGLSVICRFLSFSVLCYSLLSIQKFSLVQSYSSVPHCLHFTRFLSHLVIYCLFNSFLKIVQSLV